MDEFENNFEGMDGIENSILESLSQIVLQPGFNKISNRNFTYELLTSIGRIGECLDYKVCSSVNGGAWLYDLIWYSDNVESENLQYLKSLELVLESELSDRRIQGIKFDFEKLLIANSRYKVFICFGEGNYHSPENVNNLIRYFNKAVEVYEGRVERILILICEDYNSGNIYPHLIIKK